jgi:AraC-like DNA-binding protein
MADVLRVLGHDPVAVLRASGLDATAFDDPDRRIAFRVAADLIRRGALRAGREDFGLLVGERFDFDDFGLLGRLMWRAGRVGEALYDLNRFLHLQDRGSVTYVRPAGDGLVALGYSIFDPDTPGAALIYDLVMAIGLRLLRALAGPGFRAVEVCLPHVAPRQRAAYRRVFAAPLRFDAPRAEIVFDAAWLHAPVAGGDQAQHELVQRAIRLVEAGVAPGLAGRVRAAVRVLLMIGDTSAARIAAALGLHERTLRRRLAGEGESLQAMVAQARFEVACQLLRETELGLADIADALGFAEAPAFVRAFRGWAACTPGRWRAQQQGGRVSRRRAARG